MRFLNWDVLLFPPASCAPLQEYRTACFAVLDTEHLDGDAAAGTSPPWAYTASSSPLVLAGDPGSLCCLRQIPILATWVAGLEPDTEFRVSVHSWSTPVFSDRLRILERDNGFLPYFEARVVIDGVVVS